MNEQDADNDYVMAFDHFYTNNHIQILKSILPFLDHSTPVMLPVLIKYMELQYTIDLMKKGERPCLTNICASNINGNNGNIFSLLQDPALLEQLYHAIRKYLAPNEDKSFQQILQMFQTMENMKEMQQMMELFQSMQPDSSSATGTNSSNAFGGLDLSQMLGGNVNIQELMQLFKNMS